MGNSYSRKNTWKNRAVSNRVWGVQVIQVSVSVGFGQAPYLSLP